MGVGHCDDNRSVDRTLRIPGSLGPAEVAPPPCGIAHGAVVEAIGRGLADHSADVADAPQTPTERALAAIWSEILQVAPIRRDDSFMALSGDSLQALQLALRIEELFNKQLELASLLTAESCLEQMARWIDGDETSAGSGSGSSAILFQSGTRYPALFCLPCIFGSLWEFQKLARQLGPEFTVYGLQTPGLDGVETPCATIGELADHYLREVRRVQPAGPYCLAGFSFGGTVAYELAQRLAAQGERVELLALLDPPVRGHRRGVWLFHRSVKLVQGVLRTIAAKAAATLSPGEHSGQTQATLEAQGNLRFPPGRSRVFATNRRALDAYEARPYPGSVLLFRGMIPPLWPKRLYDDTCLEWIDLAQGGSDVCWVPSRHEDFFQDGTIEFLAEPLRARVRARFEPAADHQDETELSAGAPALASTAVRFGRTSPQAAAPSAATGQSLADGGPATCGRFFSPGVCSLKHSLLTSLPLAAADGVAASAMLALAAGLAALVGLPVGHGLGELLVAVVASLLGVFLFAGLYPGVGLHAVVELRKIGWATTLVFTLCILAARVEYASATAMLLMSWPFVVVAIPLARGAVRWLCAGRSWWGHRIVILGTGPAGRAVYRHLRENPTIGLRPLGLLDDRPLPLPSTEPVAYLGPLANAATIAAHEGIPWAIVAMPEKPSDEVLRVVTRYADCFPHLLVVPDTAGLPTLWIDAHECGGLPAWRMTERLLLPMPRLTKRFMDLAAIVVCGPMLLAIMGMVAVLIKLGSPGPVFYCQRRIGRGGKHFYAWKFRSMVRDADAVLERHLAANPALRQEWNRDQKLRNDPRVTRIGRFLRKTSIDELPQLWNVLRGEMSLVGPRPIVDAEVAKYGTKFELYSKVTPGISGLWQISGRNDTTYPERVALDAFYARNWSCWLDLYILACTVRTVVSRAGAY